MMQDRHCFVPGCQTGYRKQIREFKKNGKRNPSLFRVKMNDQEMLQLWRKAIPRTDKEFSFVNSVCELHFQENEIEKQFVHKMPDGSIHTIDRERQTLKSGAIPSIFPNLQFPKDKALRTAWAKATKRKGTQKDSIWTPSSESTYLCSNHFLPADFEVSQATKRLREGVIPSAFNFDTKNEMQKPRKTYSRKKDSVEMFDQQENRNLEYINCCIPGCKSKSHRKRGFNTAEKEENTLMFPVPCASELFSKWTEALKSTNIELTKDDHICECHFRENDIQRYCKTETIDGDYIIQERLPVLKPHAVPVKYLKLAADKTKESFKKLTVLQNPDVMNSDRSISDKSSYAFSSCDSGSNAISIENEIPDDSSVQNLTDSSINSLQGQISHKKKCMPYSFLVESIQLVKKPSMYWSVVCTDQFTIFARWNNKFITEKRLVIESSLTIRVFLKEWEIEMTDLVDITSVDDLSSLLEKVENYKI